ncbi:MAG: saccharopine dehydrogenase NADP-binding domain-containing protein [Methanospirillum sp.]|nr:saccharopine dehydrogenase NADP-binding domain-containing protein [Methanospirillum sp.]
MDFKKKVLIIGYGAVARATLPLLLRHVNIAPENITIIDSRNKEHDLSFWIKNGIRFFRTTIKPGNYAQILSDYLSAGDLLIDLSVSIDCYDILSWCHDHRVLYINASVEVWDPYCSEMNGFTYEKTLHYRQMRLLNLTKRWQNTTTCIVDHGANPGLISHFAKKGLVDIAEKLIADGKAENPPRISRLISEKRYPELAMVTGIQVIHCSERDTQVSKYPKRPDEFVNTWSVEGFYEEAIAPAEIGWGTHECILPVDSYLPPEGIVNELIFKKMGINTWIRSWIPDEEITGMVIRHGEAFGLSDRWTVRKNGEVVYRPTVCYVYKPCSLTLESLDEIRSRNYDLHATQRILRAEEISSGADILGSLLMGHPYSSWWTGSILSIEESARLVPGQNATTIQVGIGLVAAVMWMIENPENGFCLPDDLPYDYILRIAEPFLGRYYSGPSDWTPAGDKPAYTAGSGEADRKIWQFEHFASSYESFKSS